MNCKRIFRSPATWVFVVAMAIRVYAGVNSHIVNPDGVYYIQQAKAIFYGQWDLVTKCTVPYISLYSILVAAAYGLLGDWVVAGRGVSLCFGVGMFVPLYLILRQFFTRRISSLTLLVYAFIPVLVSRSPGVVRGPTFWFFLLWGIYLYIRHLRFAPGDRRIAVCLVLSNVAFLLAAWARIEALLFIPFSCAHLLLVRGEDKTQRILVFLSPLLAIGAAATMAAALYQVPVGQYVRVDDVTAKLTRPFANYRETMISVEAMAKSLGKENRISDYLMFASNLTWLIALGTLFSYAFEAYFYPYFVFFLLGLPGAWRASRKDAGAAYLFWSTAAAALLIYFHLIEWWYMYNRFLALVMMPSCIFAGYGLTALANYFERHHHIRDTVIASGLVAYIVLFGLVKNLMPIEADKVVFREVGEWVAKTEGNARVNRIAGIASTVQRWAVFYANLKYPGVYCISDAPQLEKNANAMMQRLKEANISYLLWEENRWGRSDRAPDLAPIMQRLTPVKRWFHPDTGELILYHISGN